MTSEDDDFDRLAMEARDAVARLAMARYGGRMNPDWERAVVVMSTALDVLKGDETAAPYALDRVRQMHDALVTTTYRSIDACIETAARNLRLCAPGNRVHMARAFVEAIDPHIRFIGSNTRRFATDDVIAILEKWRKSPKMGTGQLSTRGVIERLQELAGVTRARSRSRARRLPP